MDPDVMQVMVGLVLLVGGAAFYRLTESPIGWVLFVLGIVVGVRGGIRLSQTGEKEIGN